MIFEKFKGLSPVLLFTYVWVFVNTLEKVLGLYYSLPVDVELSYRVLFGLHQVTTYKTSEIYFSVYHLFLYLPHTALLLIASISIVCKSSKRYFLILASLVVEVGHRLITYSIPVISNGIEMAYFQSDLMVGLIPIIIILVYFWSKGYVRVSEFT